MPSKVAHNPTRPTVFNPASFCFVQLRQFLSVFSHLWSCQTRAVSNQERVIVARVRYVIYYMVSFNSKSKFHNLSIYGQRDPKTAIVICVVCYITAAQSVCWHWCCVHIKRARCPHRLRTSVFQVKTNQGVHRGSISTCRGSVRDLAINITSCR